MDTKFKRIMSKLYGFMIIGLILSVIIGVFSFSRYNEIENNKVSYSYDYYEKKRLLNYWEEAMAYGTNIDVYTVTKYFKVFDESQEHINSYSRKMHYNMVEFLVYNTKTKKYFTNSNEVKENIKRYTEDINLTGNLIESELTTGYITSTSGITPDISIADIFSRGDKPTKHSQFIKDQQDYKMYFWIPKKEFAPKTYFGLINVEEQSLKDEKQISYNTALISGILAVALLACIVVFNFLSSRSERKEALNNMWIVRLGKFLLRYLLELKKYLFDIRSITFKFVCLIVGFIMFAVLKRYFENNMYTGYIFLNKSELYFDVIDIIGLIIVIIIMFNFTMKLQKTINSTSDSSIDITKDKFVESNLKKLRNNLSNMKGEVSKANNEQMKNERLKAELVTNISHDLKTPLTSIINYTDILLNKDITDEEKEDYLKILNNKSLKLKLLIEDLFEISKITSGKEELNRSSVNVVELLNQSLGEFSSNIKDNNIEFYISCENKNIILNLDGKKMSRVFENLISNISKYSLSGTRAYIDVLDLEDKVNITFKNISKERLNTNVDELFNRFTRGDKARNSQVEGNGLGLAIAQSIVELHNGKIDVTIDGDLFKVEITLFKNI